MLKKDTLDKLIEIYLESENIMKKSGGWKGYNIFYNPQGDYIHLAKISISFETKRVPSKSQRIKKLRKEMQKRYLNEGYLFKKSIDLHNAFSQRFKI